MHSTCISSESNRRVACTSCISALHCSCVGGAAGERDLIVVCAGPVGGELKLGLVVSQQVSC